MDNNSDTQEKCDTETFQSEKDLNRSRWSTIFLKATFWVYHQYLYLTNCDVLLKCWSRMVNISCYTCMNIHHAVGDDISIFRAYFQLLTWSRKWQCWWENTFRRSDSEKRWEIDQKLNVIIHWEATQSSTSNISIKKLGYFHLKKQCCITDCPRDASYLTITIMITRLPLCYLPPTHPPTQPPHCSQWMCPILTPP